jgi:phage terminase large subunit-like protein
VVGPHVRNSCRRHIEDLVSGPKRGLTWDPAASEWAINFFPDVLRLAGGQFEGKRYDLHPSQQFKTGCFFGWKKADGTRRFRRLYDEEAKGNGKTPWAAGLGHYFLIADGEKRAEVYAAAANMLQAQVLFRAAVAMWEQSPTLSRILTGSGNAHVYNLAYLRKGSFFRPISGEVRKTGSGPSPSAALCDEVHEHPDRLTIEMLERGFKWRQQPALIMTTNSGSDRNSACWEEHQHAVRVAAGTMNPDEDFTYVGEIVDDETFSYVCSLDKGDDPLEDPRCWVKANPLIGITIQDEYLEGVVRQAKSIPGKLNGILRLHFCVWTDAETSWMGRQALESCLSDFDPSEHKGEKVYVGVDLSAAKDLTVEAFVVKTGTKTVERMTEAGIKVVVSAPTYDLWVEAWTPGDTIRERSIKDSAPYDVWVRQGHLHAPEGKVVNMAYPAACLSSMATEYSIELVAYDRYAFRKFEDELDAIGLTLQMIEHPQGGKRRASLPEEYLNEAKLSGEEAPQGLWMPGSVTEFESAILEERIRIKRNPVLVSAIMSTVLEEDPWGNRWLSKRKAVNRIDAAVASAMALGAASLGVESIKEREYKVMVF